MTTTRDPKRRWSSRGGEGECYKWILAHVGHDGADCLIWPFSRKQDGRGSLSVSGVRWTSHVLMCTLVHGHAPSDIHEVAHSCGNGHGGCVHPKHVSWKTPTENHIDTILHGNAHKPGTPRRKLTNQDVAEIRVLKDYLTQAERAVMFGVSNTTIAEIDRGRARTGRPKRHRGTAYPEPERSEMMATAARMRDAGATLELIAKTLRVARLTARTWAKEGRGA